MNFSAHVRIEKSDEDQRLVWGWASIVENADGSEVVDLHGASISPEVLQKAAHVFVMHYREAGDMHATTSGIGRLVECVVTTRETQKAWGLPEGALPVGMWVGFKIESPAVWEMIKSGKYGAFSIGGWGREEPV